MQYDLQALVLQSDSKGILLGGNLLACAKSELLPKLNNFNNFPCGASTWRELADVIAAKPVMSNRCSEEAGSISAQADITHVEFGLPIVDMPNLFLKTLCFRVISQHEMSINPSVLG